ncbi:hypothetical protein D9M71_609620 [compost metagenome]
MRDAGVTQQQAGFELVADRVLQPNRVHQIALVFELDQVKAPERRGVLVLPATGDTEAQAFGLKRQFGDLVGVPAILAQLVEDCDGCSSGGRRTAQARADREIRSQEQIESVTRLDHCDDSRQQAFIAGRQQGRQRIKMLLAPHVFGIDVDLLVATRHQGGVSV